MRKKTETKDSLRNEYNRDCLRGAAVRGKYYERYWKGNNVVLLEPDVAKAVPDAASVNQALRLLMTVANKSQSHARK